MGAIEIAKATRLPRIGLIVGEKAQLKVREAARATGGVQLFRPGVAAEKFQTTREPSGHAGLKRVVAGIERSLADIRSRRYSLKGKALNDIFEGVGSYTADRMLGTGKKRLIEFDASRQMRRFGSDISDLEEQIGSEFGLKVEIVLLGVWILQTR